MKRLKLDREIVSKDQEKIVIRTIIEDEYSMEEAIKTADQRTSSIARLEQEKKQLEESIEKQTWLENLDDFKKAIESEKSFKELIDEGLKEYMESLFEKGKVKVEHKKKEESYDRLPADATEKRASIKNKILNDIREELGIKDMAHPIMLRLRHETFNEVQ